MTSFIYNRNAECSGLILLQLVLSLLISLYNCQDEEYWITFTFIFTFTTKRGEEDGNFSSLDSFWVHININLIYLRASNLILYSRLTSFTHHTHSKTSFLQHLILLLTIYLMWFSQKKKKKKKKTHQTRLSYT